MLWVNDRPDNSYERRAFEYIGVVVNEVTSIEPTVFSLRVAVGSPDEEPAYAPARRSRSSDATI